MIKGRSREKVSDKAGTSLDGSFPNALGHQDSELSVFIA